MFDNFDIVLGATNSGLPSMVIEYGNSSYEVFSFLQYDGVLTTIEWVRNISGFVVIAGACIRVISNIHSLLSGEAKLIGNEES